MTQAVGAGQQADPGCTLGRRWNAESHEAIGENFPNTAYVHIYQRTPAVAVEGYRSNTRSPKRTTASRHRHPIGGLFYFYPKIQ